MNSNEKFKKNGLNYIAFSTVVVIIILTAISIIWITSSSKNEFTLTIFNTSNKSLPIEVILFEGTEEEYQMHSYGNLLNPNQSCMIYFKNYQSYNIYKILIKAINYSWQNSWYEDPTNNSIEKVDAHAFYYFPTGKPYDLLAIIDTSGTTMTATKMPKPEYPITIDFN